MELGFFWLCVFTTVVAAAAHPHVNVKLRLPRARTSISSPIIHTPLSPSTTSYFLSALKLQNLYNDSAKEMKEQHILQHQLDKQKRLESYQEPIFRSTIDRGSPTNFPIFLSQYNRIPIIRLKKTVSNRKTKDTEDDEHSEAAEKLTVMIDDIVHDEENNRIDHEAETELKNKPQALTLARSNRRSQCRHNIKVSKHQNAKRMKEQRRKKYRDDEKEMLDNKKKLAEKKLEERKKLGDYYLHVLDYLRDLLPDSVSDYVDSGEVEETRDQEAWSTSADDSFAPEEYEPSFSKGEDAWK